MIYTVTFNPALDYVVTLDEFNKGSLNRMKSEQILAGGKGINVSIVLKNLGVENTALGFIAGFTGRQIESMLKENGINTDFIYIKDGMSRINIKVKSREETEINGIGPNINDENIQELYNRFKMLSKDDILVLAGSIPSTLPNSIYSDIMKDMCGKGIKFIVDATGKLLLNVLKYKPFLVKPNKEELEEMFGVKIKTRQEVVYYGRKLRDGGANNVLISMGQEGAILIDEYGDIHDIKAPEGKTINTVGAGDSMVAGFLAGYLEKSDYIHALKMGIAAGSASAFSKYLATKDEVKEIYRRV